MDDSKLSIRVNVDGRIYPMTVKRTDEENIRKAVSLINEKLKMYKLKYNTLDGKDSFDFLAMVAIDFVAKYFCTQNTTSDTELLSELQILSGDIEDYINKY